jgi:transposase-like protein
VLVQACPYCRSMDIRLLTRPNEDPAAFRCHDCARAFTLSEDAVLPRGAAKPEPPKPRQNRSRTRR